MFSSRRIWRKYGTRTLLTGLVISTAWVIRQTQGAVITEIYGSVVRPFSQSPNQEEQLTNAKIKQLNEELAELKVQNDNFKQLLGYVESQDKESIVAPVVGRSADHWWHQVTLARGSRDGVKVGYVVVGIGGLVGRITSVTPHTSRVLLVSDPTSKVGVAVSRTRDMGAMKGAGTDRALMEFFEKVPDVRKGDVVTTSQHSQIWPTGIPIGTIESIDTESGPAPQATIKLSAPIGQLEWLIIHPFESKL